MKTGRKAERSPHFDTYGGPVRFSVSAYLTPKSWREFYAEFTAADPVSLPIHNFYLKLMVNGAVSSPFSAETLGPFD